MLRDSYKKKRRESLKARLEAMEEKRGDKGWEFKNRSNSGSTNKEKERKKNYLMVQKSRRKQTKMQKSWKQVNRKTRKGEKVVMNHDAKKRRRI